MTDVMRELINGLMGSAAVDSNLPPYDHHTVCRAFLVECCPADILSDTRLDALVVCNKVHNVALRSDYLRAQADRDHYYDLDGFDALEGAVRVVDGEIRRIRDKLKKDVEQLTDEKETDYTLELFELNEKIGKTAPLIEKMGSEGKVSEAAALSDELTAWRARKAELEQELKSRSYPGCAPKLRVCDECSAQLNVLDNETRLADHYQGRMHEGMIEIREKYQKMKETIEARRQARRDQRDRRYGGDHRNSDRDRGDRDRDRDRDRGDRDRGADRHRGDRGDRDRRDSRRRSSRSPTGGGRGSDRRGGRSRSRSRDRERSRR